MLLELLVDNAVCRRKLSNSKQLGANTYALSLSLLRPLCSDLLRVLDLRVSNEYDVTVCELNILTENIDRS